MLLKKVKLYQIVLLGAVIKILFFMTSQGSSYYSIIDELAAYTWGSNLTYYSHARFFSSYLPGPWQNVLAYALVNIFASVSGMYWGVIFLGVVQIVLIYYFIYTVTLKREIALLGAFLTATQPWSVGYLATFWNPYFIIPLVTMFLICLVKLERDSRSPVIALLVILFALMTFFHLIVLFALPFLFYFIVIRKRFNIDKKFFSLGIIVGFVMYSPFLINDFKSNFFILGGYLEGSKNIVRFKWESLKFITDILVVSSQEISRFIGHKLDTLLFFLSKSYGSYVVGFLFMGMSYLGALYFFQLFFKIVKDKQHPLNSVMKIFFIYMLSIIVAFFLTLRPHEIRYNVIWWPILILIISLGIEDLWRKSFKKKVLGFLLLIYLLNGFYLTTQIAIFNYNPNYKDEIRLIPSLVVFEKIEKSLKKEIYKNKSLSNLKRKDNLNSNLELSKIFYDQSHTKSSLNTYKEKLHAKLLLDFIRFNNFFKIVDKESEANYSFSLVSFEQWKEGWKEGWEEQDRQAKGYQKDYKVIERLSNGLVILKKN